MKTLIKPIALATLLLATGAQAQTWQSWMSPEVQKAWDAGYKGQSVTIQVIDDFKSRDRFAGDLGTGPLTQRHGEWTRLEAGMIAPAATLMSVDFTSKKAVKLTPGLNVLNLSYGMYAIAGYPDNQIRWDTQTKSIISHAHNGAALIAKAAGNDAVAVGAANDEGLVDYLNRALIGTQSAIFVGALNRNSTEAAQATLAYYSNFAGNDPKVQQNFVVVGVDGEKTGLYGTSFAAPIVSGYGAILGSKFTQATPTQIGNQLLDTARTDTIANYNAAVHGRGEASISRALAPVSIR